MMDDDDNEKDAPEQPQRFFTVTEAEHARQELEPVLIEAMECRRKLAPLEEDLTSVAARIMMMGGVTVPYEKLAGQRLEHMQISKTFRAALERIDSAGCVVKDLDVGLLDFPAILHNEEVYLCWKVGEDRIRYYHRRDEGFGGRKPIDPRDLGPSDFLQ